MIGASGRVAGYSYGPWITTADEVPEPGSLRFRSWVNGELRQDSSTSPLLFGLAVLPSHRTQAA